jgi:hypothetical protein
MRDVRFCTLALFVVALPTFGQHAFTDSGILADTPGSESVGRGNTPASPPYAPLTVREKLLRSTRATFGLQSLFFDAAAAGFDQATNTPGPWKQGAQAYGERFGSELGISMVDEYASFAIEAALHEDSRYVVSSDRSFHGRLKSVLKQTLVVKTDSGGQQFALGRFGGALAAGFTSNAWLPSTNGTPANGLETAGLLIGRDLALNFATEFIGFFRNHR